jgi:cytoskeleton protein RodZ
VESLGARLKRERERRKITLDEVSSSTKITPRMLKALEEDHFDQLPGGIFNKGFIRAYARHLGLDEEQAISDYLAATTALQAAREPEEALAAAARAADSRALEKYNRPDELPWGKLAIVLLAASLGFAIWGWRSRDHSRHPIQAATPAISTSVPDAPVPQASASPVTAASAASFTAPSDAGMTLLIHAREDSWLTIVADGKETMREILPAHSDKTVQAQREIRVRAGNTGGLDFTFNGASLPRQGDLDEVKILDFRPDGLQKPAINAPAPGNPSQP